jgi:transcription initiation factor IIE alpha subunit
MSFYRRYFFKCTECGFMLSLLGQANREIEYYCPCCEGDLDYAPKKDRDDYIQKLKDELNHIDE